MEAIKPTNYTFRQRVSFLFGRTPLTVATQNPSRPRRRRKRGPVGKVKPAGRRTAVIQQEPVDSSSLLGALGLIGRVDKERVWRSNNYDQSTFDKLDTDELIEMLVDLSPEASRILWDLLRFSNSGYTLRGLNLHDDNENEQVKAWLADMETRLGDIYGTVSIVFNRAFASLALRGAVFGEVVLNDEANESVDLIVADPMLADFQKKTHPVRGTIDALGQQVNGTFVDLSEVLTVSYIPLDPLPGDPYGRGLLTPVIFTTLFGLGLLHDLRRVIMQQGYTRYHVKVKIEELIEIFDQVDIDGEDEEEEFSEFLDETIDTLRDMLENLQPDESLVTTDAVEMTSPGGALSDKSIDSADAMLRAIQRLIIVGGKTMPLLMASNEAVSETHANRQWEIHVATVRTLQHIVESFIERLLGVGLRAAGIQGRVELRFAELRKSERMRDELVQQQVNLNAQFQYLMGWISHEDASEMATGKKPARDRPLVIDMSTGADLVDGDGLSPYAEQDGEESGNNGRLRGMWDLGMWRIVGENDPLPPVPRIEDITDEDMNRAINRWDTLMPNYAGLLNASIEGVASTPSDWTFDREANVYTNNETGEVVDQARLVELRDEFASVANQQVERGLMDAVGEATRLLLQSDILMVEWKARVRKSIKRAYLETRNGVESLAERLVNEDITLQEWVIEMRLIIKDAYIAQYVAAKGGRHNMTAADWGRIGRMMAPDGQYQFLNGFANDIVDKDLSLRQIVARGNLYINSSTQAFERGKAALYGIRLPAYPADGSQVCLSNCKCSWEIVLVDGVYHCYWRLNGSAEHCETCLANSAAYSPYIAEPN